MLLETYPKASKASNEILTEEEDQIIHPVIYESIDSDLVRDVIKKTRGSAETPYLDYFLAVFLEFFPKSRFEGRA